MPNGDEQMTNMFSGWLTRVERKLDDSIKTQDQHSLDILRLQEQHKSCKEKQDSCLKRQESVSKEKRSAFKSIIVNVATWLIIAILTAACTGIALGALR